MGEQGAVRVAAPAAFAAANALFSFARRDAPRLLGLDEAFAGVDDNGRGELMSLAKQLDLNLFMTGYHRPVAKRLRLDWCSAYRGGPSSGIRAPFRGG